MKLYIAEKPSLARAIIDALPTPHHKAEGCVYVGHSDKTKCDVVSWCIGHILEQAEPEAYNTELKKWSLTHLPILPDQFEKGWQLTPKKQTRKQFTQLKKLIKQASEIIHCGDPDREGQLLVDEVIHYVGIKKNVKSTLKRCLISDLNRPAVKVALSNLNYLMAERIAIKGLATKTGVPHNPQLPKGYASPLEVENYIANERLNNPAWVKAMQTASPAAVNREQLMILAEIESELQRNHLDHERLLATLSIIALQSSQLSQMTLINQAQKVNHVIDPTQHQSAAQQSTMQP